MIEQHVLYTGEHVGYLFRDFDGLFLGDVTPLKAPSAQLHEYLVDIRCTAASALAPPADRDSLLHVSYSRDTRGMGFMNGIYKRQK